MLTTDMRRTNSVPLNVVIVCLVLFVARVAMITWTVFNSPAPLAATIRWQDPKELGQPTNSLDGKPGLLFFYERNAIPFDKIVESTILANRLVVAQIQRDFVPYKLMFQTETSEGERVDVNPVASKLADKYSVFGLVHVVAILPDGYKIDSTGITSDRGFKAFLDDALHARTREMAFDLISKRNFAQAGDTLLKRIQSHEDTERVELESVLWTYCCYTINGDKDKAAQALKLVEPRRSDQLAGACIDYLQGKISDKKLSDEAKQADDQRLAYLVQAMKAFGANDKKAAIDLLKKSLGSYSSTRNDIANGALKKLGAAVNEPADKEARPGRGDEFRGRRR